ncbi:MAG: hypothetical protein C5B59_05865 [Bacteroidetes bacterium]|nr:MAG: hypothetical protein C5B59_05865 [Bacteroidota bacterium]
MKSIYKIIFPLLFIAGFYVACDKAEPLSMYKSGTQPTLSSSTNTIAPAPSDSSNSVVTFSWTDSHFATDSASVKYIVEMDSSGRNFSKETTWVLSGQRSISFTAKQLNTVLLGYGFSFGVSYSMDVRITASYANNNDQKISNVVTVQMTPYKVPPKVQPPTSGKLFLVGSATQGGWANPVPVPTQEFSQIDSVTYAGVFDITGGNQYLFLPVNGDWGHKYSVADNTITGLANGGDFGYDLKDNFPGPANTGKYVIWVDFQAGKFTVTPFTGNLPDSLYMVGDATAGGWANPVPVPSQQFTRDNSSLWELTLPLTGGKQYLFLPKNGDWTHKYAVQDNTIPGLANGGTFGYDYPKNFPGPSADGTYKIEVNFATSLFKVTKQ